MHGLATGAESRQQLYTMLTRGRTANHLYLQVVGDGDPHSVIHPDTIRPRTPVDLLEQILARDDTPRSATTTQSEQRDPAVRLGDATARYLDALHAAAEDLAGPAVVDRLDTAADQLIPGLTGEPAWPALRAHLLLLAARGADPIAQLQAAAGVRELDTRRRPGGGAGLAARRHRPPQRRPGTAALAPRHPPPPRQRRTVGPVPQDPVPAGHRTGRPRSASRGRDAEPARLDAHRRPPSRTELVADVAVWRAAMQVSPDDRRPTGPRPTAEGRPQLAAAPRHRASTGPDTPALQEWGPLIAQAGRSASSDTFLPVLAERLAAISRTGINAAQLLHTAINTGPLPDEHGAAALWWRISRHLQPAVTAAAGHDHSPHHRLGRPAGRAGRRRPGRPPPAQPVVAGAGVGGRPRPAARLAPRPTPHPRHVAPRSTTSARRWCGASRCSPTRHPTRTRRRTRRPPIRPPTSIRTRPAADRSSRSGHADQPIRTDLDEAGR